MKKIALLIAAILLTSPMAYAEFIDLQAQKAVDEFNSLNNGQGYVYNVSPDNGRWSISTVDGYGQADFGAYSPKTSGNTYINTVCVEPIVGTAPKQIGKLNYENGSSKTTSGNALTLGSALLYTMFATGTLDGYDYDSPNYNNSNDLTQAIQFLMGSIYDINWNANDFLSGLLDLNDDKSYWEQVYDPGQYYDEIGDYSVFVMNNQDESGTHRQDFLYLAAHSDAGGSETATSPEPASLVLFGTGLGGLALSYRFRKTRTKPKNSDSI